WRRALAVGLAVTLVLLLVVLQVIPSPAVALGGSAVASWCFLVALLGAAREHVRRPAPAYLVESTLPIYILHQPTLIVVGYFGVLPLALGIWPKFVLLVVASIAVTLAIYHFLVRPFAIPRFLLGVKASREARRGGKVR